MNIAGMIRNHRELIKKLAEAILLCSFLFLISSPALGIQRSKVFDNVQNAMVVNPGSVKTVSSTRTCAMICQKMLVCMAYSVKKMAGPVNASSGVTLTTAFECRLTKGEYTWTPDADSKLMAVRMEASLAMSGYSFARDGRYYKSSTPRGNGNTLVESRQQCMGEEATFAVPYPKVASDAILAGNSFANDYYYIGITRIGTVAEGRWVTDDGDVFYSTSKTADQRWQITDPDGSGEFTAVTGAGGVPWEDFDGTWRAYWVMCRKDNLFKRSSINGKYYRMFTQRRTQPVAKAMCASVGGTLANMYSDLDFQATEGYRRRTYLLPGEVFWIGAEDPQAIGTWTWSDGTAMQVADKPTDQRQIRLWLPNEPNVDTTARCMGIGAYGADNVVCTGYTFPFLCEIPADI